MNASIIAPRIFWPEDVEHVDYGHLPQLLYWLHKEAQAHLDGRAIEPHVAIINGKLRLLLRHMANAQLPAHRIWLDATANAALYERVIDWPVEQVKPHVKLLGPVYQVWDSSNTRSSLIEEGKAAAKAYRVKLQVEHIVKHHGYQRPLIVSYSQLDTLFDGYDFTYFYGNRGTNKYEECDAVIIIGTPQPSTTELVKDARMLFIDREVAFDGTWCEKDLPFAHYRADDGLARSGVVSGFWNDDDLQLVLDQLRMAEIVQSAHRVRPVLAPKPIWLLTSLPVEDLPPTELLSVRELFDTPPGVDPYIWPLIVEYGREKLAQRGFVTAADYVDLLGVQRKAANNYVDSLAACFPNEFPLVQVKAAGRGRPPKAAGRTNKPSESSKTEI